MDTTHLTSLSDSDLLATTTRVAADARRSTADLVALLAEVDARRIYLGEGYSSLFAYCTQMLHLSEHAAHVRIEAARASRRLPVLLDMLASGDVTLTTVRLLAPHLTLNNHAAVLASARHKSKREIETLVATLAPKPDVPSTVRKAPAPASAATLNAPPVAAMSLATAPVLDVPRAANATLAPAASSIPVPCQAPATPRSQPSFGIKPLSPARYTIKVTVSTEAHGHLRRAQDLLRHAVPNGDPAADVALSPAHADAARKPASWSFTTSFHSPPAARRPRRTWNSDAAPTISTRRGCSSERSEWLRQWIGRNRGEDELVLERVRHSTRRAPDLSPLHRPVSRAGSAAS